MVFYNGDPLYDILLNSFEVDTADSITFTNLIILVAVENISNIYITLKTLP